MSEKTTHLQDLQATCRMFWACLRVKTRASIGFAGNLQDLQAQTPLLLEKKEIDMKGGKEREEKSQGGHILQILQVWLKPSIHAGSDTQASPEMPAGCLQVACRWGCPC